VSVRLTVADNVDRKSPLRGPEALSRCPRPVWGLRQEHPQHHSSWPHHVPHWLHAPTPLSIDTQTPDSQQRTGWAQRNSTRQLNAAGIVLLLPQDPLSPAVTICTFLPPPGKGPSRSADSYRQRVACRLNSNIPRLYPIFTPLLWDGVCVCVCVCVHAQCSAPVTLSLSPQSGAQRDTIRNPTLSCLHYLLILHQDGVRWTPLYLGSSEQLQYLNLIVDCFRIEAYALIGRPKKTAGFEFNASDSGVRWYY
jgi:hypothetical protein